MAYENGRDTGHGGAGSFALGVLMGAAVGAGLALLLAPRSGREFREDLAGRARKARESAADGYRQGREKVEQAVVKGRERVEQAVVKGREAVDKARGVAQRTKEDIKQNVNDLVGSGREA